MYEWPYLYPIPREKAIAKIKAAAREGNPDAAEMLRRIHIESLDRALALLRSLQTLDGNDKDEVERLLEEARDAA
jgi:hypothetical protein